MLMVNLEEIRGEHKKLYKTPDMEIVYLTWADIVTTSNYTPEDPNAHVNNDTNAEDETIGGGG